MKRDGFNMTEEKTQAKYEPMVYFRKKLYLPKEVSQMKRSIFSSLLLLILLLLIAAVQIGMLDNLLVHFI